MKKPYNNNQIYNVKKDTKINRIKEVLEERGIKQVWLSNKIGKTYSIVNGYVQNRKQPSLETLYEIAQVLGVEPSELLTNKFNVKNEK